MAIRTRPSAVECALALGLVVAAGDGAAQSTRPTVELGGGGPLGDSLRQGLHCTHDAPNLPVVTGAAASKAALMTPFTFFPMGGRLFGDIFTNNYVDLSPTSTILDFKCGAHSYNGHQGNDTDIRGFDEQAIGVPVFAAADGTVVASHDGEFDQNTSWSGQPANYVIVDHGSGLRSLYWHLKKNSVAVTVGQAVVTGTQLGQVGSSGISTGPHLHFEVQKNGSAVEPFAGTCNPIPSYWSQQTPVAHETYANEFSFSPVPLTGISPPFSMPRTGQVALGGSTLYFWTYLKMMPAQSTWRVVFLRPNGTLAFDSGTGTFGNPQPYRWSWWWFTFNTSFLATTIGTWQVELWVNDRMMFRTPFEVTAAGANVPNRVPEPIQVRFEPAAPAMGDILRCVVDTSQILDDRDYDIVRYRYLWKWNGIPVRDVTTAAQSDAIARTLITSGSSLTCEVTPKDAIASGPSVSTSVVVGAPDELHLTVHGSMNIFSAGHSVSAAPGGGGAGLSAVEIPLGAPQGRSLSFPSISGMVTPGAQGLNGAEGGTLYGGLTDVYSYDGIAGVRLAGKTMFLSGVFVGAGEPTNPAPARLDFTNATEFLDLCPVLHQVFFIGDGRTSSGALQYFHAPAGATRLVLGFADASVFVGPPGYYDDDAGSLAVTALINDDSSVVKTSGAACTSSTGVEPAFYVHGCPQGGQLVTFGIRDGVPMAPAFLLAGFPAQPIPIGPNCALAIHPLLPLVIGPLALDAAGAFESAITMPAGLGAGAIGFQALIQDPYWFTGFAATNGLTLTFP